jgi:hypothetical protein
VTAYNVDVHELPLPVIDNDPSQRNPLWVEVRPGLRRIHTLAGDVLAALGKRDDVSGVGRNEHEDVGHAIAWMVAHDVTALVLRPADRLHPVIVANVVQHLDRARIPLWLLHQPPRSDSFIRKIERLTTARALEEVPLPQPAPATGHRTTADAVDPALPDADFLFFMDACRRTLVPADAEAVEQQLSRSVAQANDTLRRRGATPAAVAELVQHILNPAPRDGALITQVRGLQIAAWHHDLYIQVDLQRLLNSEERPRLAAASAEERLTVYRQPYRAITPILTLAGLGVEDISSLPIRAACPTGSSIRTTNGSIALGTATARAVRAQRHLRRNADPAQPLLPHSPKALAKALTDAAVDVGVHVHGRRAERTRDHSRSNLRALGITITSLR